jgi:hypothetical protein
MTVGHGGCHQFQHTKTNDKAGRWQTTQQERVVDITVKRKGRTTRDKRVTEKGTTQGNEAEMTQQEEEGGREHNARQSGSE